MSAISTTDELVKMGDRNFLISDNLFCFGDRQTKKTWNMVLKSFIQYFKDQGVCRLRNDEFRVSWICPTLESGRNVIKIVRKIADKFGWSVKFETNYSIQLQISDDVPYKLTLFSTEESIRGNDRNFTIVDEPEHIRDKRSFFKSLFLSSSDFLIGGVSYYPMGINPNIENPKFVRNMHGVFLK